MKSYINQKSNFYKDEKVIEFINWFVPKIDSGFTHQYINQRNKIKMPGDISSRAF